MPYRPGSEIKKDFPILLNTFPNGKRLVYLDSAATSQKPLPVMERIQRFYLSENANVSRGAHYLGGLSTKAYMEARKTVAKFVNSSTEEIVFTSGTTESINMVAYGWGDNIRPGDEIVAMSSEHHSNFVPWQQLAVRRSAKFRVVGVEKDGSIDIDKVKSAINGRTKIVAVAHVTNTFGVVNPVAEISEIAHKNGAVVVVDGAQAVPTMPVDVKGTGADFYAFSGHKMLGPMGIGVLYISKEKLGKMRPFLTGGGMIDEVYDESSSFACAPERYEAGTPNVVGAVGLAAAIDYLEGIGMKEILVHERNLLEYAYSRLEGMDRLILYGTDDFEKRTGVLPFNVEGVHPHDVATILDAHGVAIRSGHHCAQPVLRFLKIPFTSTARASFYLYNTEEDVDALVDAIDDVRRRF